MIRVLIVDDSLIFRKGLREILQSDPEMIVVGDGGDGAEAVRLCRKLAPDLVLMDLQMPGCNGIEGIKLIKESNDRIKIIALTTFFNDEYVGPALKNGVDGYILKGVNDGDLIMTIKSTMKGLGIFEQNIINQVKDTYQHCFNEAVKLDVKLTGREMEVLKLIVDGKTNKEIASTFYLSEGTIRNIISVLINRFSLKDRTQLAVFAIKHSII